MSFICYFIAETIENECITFEIYLDAKERVIFSLYGWGYSITYRLIKIRVGPDDSLARNLADC